MAELPLRGVRVLDVATVLAAPVTATFLGDFGAEVVKIEEPGRGDFTRGRAERPGGRSLQWLQEGRNKKSVTLDLRSTRGQELLHTLVPHFDVVIANYRPPTLEKWGLDPETLQRINPRAVLVYLTGYGLTGPYRDQGAFDRIASAFAGLTDVTGEPDRPPVRSGYAVIDYMGAYLSAFAAMTALYHRDVHGGPGQVVDLALYEAGFRAVEDALLDHCATGRVRQRSGNLNPYVVPASDFDTADGRRVSLHAGTDPLFARLAQVIGRPELAADPRFATRHARFRNAEPLYAIIRDWVAGERADEVVRLCRSADIPAAPVMTIADIAADPHYRERGTVVEVDDPEHGRVTMAAPMPRLSATPGRIRSLGPRLGAHTDEVLRDLAGLTDADLGVLRRDDVI
ncbi:CoA transferase [Streptomyces sp. L2]|uniref:CaiB/BaiF CoA transferase family protein n=1 Tax=Streptomyces sp. L2 TaxID=2162665 RepID=UPI0013E96342|nr:CoA transferase [Streptomyces sp. L2]